MNILFLRGFNNYFNRVIKKYSTLADYQSNSTAYVNFEGINFNPNDGVVTELVLGNESQKENSLPLDWENIGTPDYCVCYEMVGNPSAAVIRSRWFILESERLRSGQYRIALKRDVVAEHFDTIKTAPCFIEKGMVNDKTNPLLYNKESMTYNQIKDAEYELKDAYECAWIVGYVAKNIPSTSTSASTTILVEGTPTEYYDSADLPFNVSTSTTYAYDGSDLKVELAYLASTMTILGTDNYNCSQLLMSYTMTSPNNIGDDPLVNIRSRFYRGDAEDNPGITRSGRPTYVSGIPSKLIVDGYWYSNAGVAKKSLNYIGIKSSSSGQQDPSVYGFNKTNALGVINMPLQRTSNNISTIGSLLWTHAKSACSTAFSSYGSVVTDTNNNKLNYYNGKIVKYNNKYYIMNLEIVSYRSGVFKVLSNGEWTLSASDEKINGLTQYYSAISNSTDLTNLRNDITSLCSSAFYSPSTTDSTYGSYAFRSGRSFDACALSMPRYSIKLTQIVTEDISTTVPAASNRNTTYDSPCDLFAIPYGELPFRTTLNGTTYVTNKDEGLALARAIAKTFGDNACYDLQLVPYCPIRSLPVSLSGIAGVNATISFIRLYNLDSKSYIVANKTIGGTTEPCSFVLFPSSSKGTFDIILSVNNYNYENYSDALNTKINNETTLCRLASPNFNGMFEFSLAKNDGITKFNVDYTYKPYMPYIHVNPDFKFLYGQDWDDARGLICGGDFSLSFINSYWQTYQNNNKNYQAIFDRQIQNMDVNNAIALEKQEFQATVGTITSAIGGAMGGAAAGATAGSLAGPWGALAGGIIGAVGGGVGSGLASAYGAEKDRDWLQRQQAEARSYAIDMYGYQLGNIQAMPYSLSRTESLTNNNKIWPILELYKPTDVEIELLVNKIKYNGMTIMAVGNIQDYCTSSDFSNVFVKGQLIKLESYQINDDFHIADAIYQEINKGVYIPSGGL